MAVAEVVGVVAAVELVPVEDRLQPPQGTVLRAADGQRVPGNLWVRFNNFKLIPQEICVVFFTDTIMSFQTGLNVTQSRYEGIPVGPRLRGDSLVMIVVNVPSSS